MTLKEAHSLQLIHSNPNDSFWKTLTGKEAIRVMTKETTMIELSNELKELIQDYREACYLGEWDDSGIDNTQNALENGIQKAMNNAVIKSSEIFRDEIQRLTD